MDTITLTKNTLKTVVRESVREVLSEEMMTLRALLVPPASRAEQRDIEERYGAPGRDVAKSVTVKL